MRHAEETGASLGYSLLVCWDMKESKQPTGRPRWAVTRNVLGHLNTLASIIYLSLSPQNLHTFLPHSAYNEQNSPFLKIYYIFRPCRLEIWMGIFYLNSH